jgi:hypothetical protein
MSESINKKCSKCNFTSPLNEWAVSKCGRPFNTCVKCREWSSNYERNSVKTRMKQLEYKNMKYNTDEEFRNKILNKMAVHTICDACGKDMRLSSLRPHLLCCKGKMQPYMILLKKHNDILQKQCVY